MVNATAVDTRMSTEGLFIIAIAPAGWYEIGGGTRRWFDGRQWTDYYAPVLVLLPESDHLAESEASSLPVPLQVNHGFHLIMTIMTLCAWLPVWGVMTAVGAIRPPTTGRPSTTRSIRA